MSNNEDSEKTLPSRKDWQITDQKITEAFRSCMRSGKVPTIEEIAKKAGCDRKTVERHLEALSIADRFKTFKAATDRVIMALLKKALTGDPKSIEMWMKYIEGYSDKAKVEVTSIPAEKTTFKFSDGSRLEI